MQPGLCAQADSGRAAVGLLGRVRHAVERHAADNRDDDGCHTGHDERFHRLPPKPIGLDYIRYGHALRGQECHAPACCNAMRSARAASSGVLTLKNGSTGWSGQSAIATPCRAVHTSILRMSSLVSALRRSSRSASGHNPTTGWRHSPERAQASGTPAPILRRAWCRRSTRSSGRNGQSPGTLTIHSIPLFCLASQSRPARIPASGPAKSGTLSATTVSPVSAKRFGSPLALMMMPVHCADKVASTRSRIDTPPISMRALSPPPMRRASPPASTRPKVGGWSVVMHRGLAPMLGALFFDVSEVLVENDPFFAGECNETLAARAADQCQVRLARQLDAPGCESGS